jgi:hypothetical protein
MEKLFEGSTLYFFLIFFIPGFVSLKVYDLIVPGERRDFSKSAFDAIAYSALNFAVLLPLVLLIQSEFLFIRHKNWAVLLTYFVLLVFPAIWPFLLIRLAATTLFLRHFVHPTPDAWDYLFGRREQFWAIVHLKDLRRIGGRFGIQSFASSSPAEPQIYLEEAWKLDDNGAFLAPVERSRGILIMADEIAAVELFEYN